MKTIKNMVSAQGHEIKVTYKNKSSRRILSVLLAAVLIFAELPAVAVPASAASYENMYSNTGNQRNDIIGVAVTQLGYTEGPNNDTKYGDWYGLSNSPWCAIFISWCARQAGIPTNVLANSACASPKNGYFNNSYKSGGSYTPKPGDLFFTKSRSHVGLVYYLDGDYFYSIEGNSNSNGGSEGTSVVSLKRKVSDYDFGIPSYAETHEHNYSAVGYEVAHPHKVYKKCNCGDFFYTGETKYLDSCVECSGRTLNSDYSDYLPIHCYPISESRITVYSADRSPYQNRYIDSTDMVIILEIYTDNWCYVSYPSTAEADGYFEAYVPLSAFIDAKYNPGVWTSQRNFDVYQRTDLSTKLGNIDAGDTCLLVDINKSNKTVEVIYPVTGTSYWKMGWTSISNFQ